MTTQDIFHRLRVGLSLVVGFVSGKLLAGHSSTTPSEFFIGGFMLGFLLTQGLYWLIETLSGGRKPT
jgi:hypothetical protein